MTDHIDKIAGLKWTLLERTYRIAKFLSLPLWTWLRILRACIAYWTSSVNPGAMAAVANFLRYTASITN
jgi:hypothetical protein